MSKSDPRVEAIRRSLEREERRHQELLDVARIREQATWAKEISDQRFKESQRSTGSLESWYDYNGETD